MSNLNVSTCNVFTFYQKMRQDNPYSYYSPATQEKMKSECQELGQDRFFELEVAHD